MLVSCRLVVVLAIPLGIASPICLTKSVLVGNRVFLYCEVGVRSTTVLSIVLVPYPRTDLKLPIADGKIKALKQ